MMQNNIFSDKSLREKYLSRKFFIKNQTLIISANLEFGLIMLGLLSEYDKKIVLNLLVNLIRLTFKNGEDQKLEQILKFLLINKYFGEKDFIDKEIGKLLKQNNNKDVIMTLALYFQDTTFDIFLFVNFDHFIK